LTVYFTEITIQFSGKNLKINNPSPGRKICFAVDWDEPELTWGEQAVNADYNWLTESMVLEGEIIIF